jgi:uncharacterized membrane protein (DUF485 family)
MLHDVLLQVHTEFATTAAKLVLGLVIIWIIIISIPVWLAAKILALRGAKLTRAMLLTAIGPVIYAIILLK